MEKILIITNMYPSKKYPHYGVFVENTVHILENGGYKVIVCAMPKCDTVITKLWNYMKLYIKSILCGLFGGVDCVYTHFISHTALPVLVLKRLKKNLIIVENAHGNDVVADSELDEKNIARSRKALKVADWVIVPSAYYRDVMKEVYGVAENRIFISPSGGVNPKLFSPMPQAEAMTKIGLEPGGFWIGYIARMEKGKGWRTFLQACAKLIRENIIPDLNILIVGNGAEQNTLQGLARDLRLNSHMTYRDLVPQKDLKYYYNALNIFSFPSERESLGLVGLEAMACGVLCVCSDAEGIKSYAMHGKNCLVFERGKEDQLADEIVTLYQMSDTAKERMRMCAIETAKQYETQKTEQALLNFFREKVAFSQSER